MTQVHPINAFNDNYIWAICDGQTPDTWVVDPGQSHPVLQFLREQNRQLSGILVTHHHWDHTDGIAELLSHYPDIPIYGPNDSPFKGISHSLSQGDTLTIAGECYRIIQTPGHTLDHICYINDVRAFTGDTLFSGGCGRLFEGTAEQMWHSLQTLSTLPDTCAVYCTHEYTLANLDFANAVEPDNDNLRAYTQWAKAKRHHDQATLPSSIGNERAINPFLRTHDESILANLPEGLKGPTETPWQVFAKLRLWKDQF
ncbi:hydroxyacylglutathione hydrolase [Pseudoalteromonas luteoviolacea]|uniref:hydroxyacylglutathione hydrolase n=1 Tax=Pseudoalteromonas luteoviolacea TaxID=43657 RepID=UPI001B3893AF|nr:hydroxyacylglutathione hydrolase [Pseudoalteromonas luteoviolacea]MBQ4814511.1 hydroxyacylglutathione hydrolase [Pseudoalteromonas luteoviolacea]